MKQPYRYEMVDLTCSTCKQKNAELQGAMASHAKGRWVEYSDYAAVAAENERLKGELKAANNHIKANNLDPASIRANGLLRNQISLLIDDLTAENKRLRRAGDAMAVNYELMHSPDKVYNSDLMGFVYAWNSAKEGKDIK